MPRRVVASCIHFNTAHHHHGAPWPRALPSIGYLVALIAVVVRGSVGGALLEEERLNPIFRHARLNHRRSAGVRLCLSLSSTTLRAASYAVGLARSNSLMKLSFANFSSRLAITFNSTK